ncbi:MAG: hypothetical protein KKD28_10745 [Chloroflexi bacterium]|nr:hypothetical protein [Chloroflexota bacterium]MBU1661934.1 hypothetical protein [Chloroflexota bacterium]
MTNSPPLFPLTYTRLRFHCQAETHIRFDGLRAGSNLRCTLLNVMTQTVPSNPASPV